MTLQATLLHESRPTNPAFEPPIIIMDSHMFPQRFLSRICLLTHCAFEHSLPIMLNHMLVQGLFYEEPLPTLGTNMISLHQMHFFYVGRQFRLQNERLVANIALVCRGKRVMLFIHVTVPLVVTGERQVAVGTVSRVARARVMRVFLMAHLPDASGEDFVAEGAFEVPLVVGSLMIF
jgi:hypothetical protein